MDLTIIGVPFNSNGTTGGVARLPVALRQQHLVQWLRARGLAVEDGGDLPLGTPDPTRDPLSGIIAVASVTQVFTGVRRRVGDALRAGRFPLVLGGECSVVLGALAALRDTHGRAALLFVDGHEDTWGPWQSATGEVSDMELGIALGRTTDGLPPAIAGELPLIDRDDVFILGTRDERELAEAGVTSMRNELLLVDCARLVADLDAVAIDAVLHLERRATRWWLHVDLDVLSTVALPAVDYLQPGGLSWSQLERLTHLALASPSVVGMDVTIFNPDLDPTGGHARRIVDYLATCLGAAGRS
jgi:arginase